MAMQTLSGVFLAALSAILIIGQGLYVAGETATPSPSLHKSCIDNSQCRGENEYCRFTPQYVSPQCKAGTCVCLPNYVAWGNSACVPEKVVRRIGDACTGEAGETIAVANAECLIDKKVAACSAGFFLENAKCVVIRKCDDAHPCPAPLECRNDSVCVCPWAFEHFNTATQTCLAVEFGDRCSAKRNCNIFGDNVSGFNNGHGTCINGTCGCDSATSVQVDLVLYNNDQTLADRTLCLARNKLTTANATSMEVCSLLPVSSSVASYNVTLCGRGYMCFQCPEDNLEADQGRCRMLTSLAAQAKAVKNQDSSAHTLAAASPGHYLLVTLIAFTLHYLVSQF